MSLTLVRHTLHTKMVVVNKIMPPKGFLAINLFGVIFARKELSAVTINHESIHTAQGKELLWVGFYLLYLLEWLARLAVTFDARRAYRELSFEKEAYAHERELGYISQRKHFSEFR